MAKEIERKFLVHNERWRASATDKSSLRQAYVTSADDRSVRIRLVDDDMAKLTLKIGKGTTRDEFEYDIPVADAHELMENAVGCIIEKTRYLVPYKGFTWEVDVFDGRHRGLVIAEVEMNDETDEPALPDWLGEEVTGDERYSNQALAMQPHPRDAVHGLSHTA